MMRISRKDFLTSVGSATAGAALGVVGHRELTREPPSAPAIVRQPPPPVPTAVSDTVRKDADQALPEEGASESFAQSGEDLIVVFMFRYLGIRDITYLDVGAFHPTNMSNTYLLYKMGYRGVLVEPNVTMCEQLRAVRPKDKTLAAGIGVTPAREADYYVMTDPSWNTFSKKEAEHEAEVTNGQISIREVIKMPLLSINDVMAEHFKAAPTFLSVDTESLDLAILKTIDFKRFRPKVICAETVICGTKRTIPEIPAFMATQGYVVRGETFVNTIFVDSALL